VRWLRLHAAKPSPVFDFSQFMPAPRLPHPVEDERYFPPSTRPRNFSIYFFPRDLASIRSRKWGTVSKLYMYGGREPRADSASARLPMTRPEKEEIALGCTELQYFFQVTRRDTPRIAGLANSAIIC
jgi:hypothetical protein